MSEEQLKALHKAWFERTYPIVYLQYVIYLEIGLNQKEALIFKESERLWLTNKAYRERRKIKPYRPYISIQA